MSFVVVNDIANRIDKRLFEKRYFYHQKCVYVKDCEGRVIGRR